MFENMSVQLTDQEWKDLIEAFLNVGLSPASLDVYRETLANTNDAHAAVFEGIRNEAVIAAITTVIIDRKSEESMSNIQVKSDPTSPTKKQYIWVTFRKEGIHSYPAAATDPNLATGGWDDVSFLAHPHRHMFHFRVEIEIFHDDRDIEFIQFKRELENLYSNGTLLLNHKSCEMISDDLYQYISNRWPGRDVTIEIAEDGENGSRIFYGAGV